MMNITDCPAILYLTLAGFIPTWSGGHEPQHPSDRNSLHIQQTEQANYNIQKDITSPEFIHSATLHIKAKL